MKSHNLYSANGYELNYPHFTKWGAGNVHAVSDPENKITVGDEVFVATESKRGEETVYAYIHHRQNVLEIVEERPARGQHKTSFKPIFQELKVTMNPPPKLTDK